MNDWLGLLFFIVFIAGAFIGLKILSKSKSLSAEEFEKNAAQSASLLGASMNALQELMNPEAAKAREVQTQLKEGRYNKKKREGKAGASGEDLESEI